MLAAIEGRTGIAAIFFAEHETALCAERKPQDSQEQEWSQIFHTPVKLHINAGKSKVSWVL
jgi:hypothetical protein